MAAHALEGARRTEPALQRTDKPPVVSRSQYSRAYGLKSVWLRFIRALKGRLGQSTRPKGRRDIRP